MMLYVAAAKPLPQIPWDEKTPAFNVSELNVREDSVRKQFSKPYIYCVGAHTGCGCGFSYGQFQSKSEELEERESVARLSLYLSEAVALAGEVELYSCWDGDQEEPPEFNEVVSYDEIPTDIGGNEFCFAEREFIIIRP